jgi:hypothetical protein
MPTITEFISTHKKLVLNKKLKVRELDEESKGVFIAFVDEGKESYDVHISIDNKTEVVKTECDCENKKPCLHQVFLAEFIADKKEISTEKLKRKSTKKIPEHHQKIDELDEIKLKDWLKKITDNNKGVRFEFMLQFKENAYTIENVEQKLIEAISSTTNNRKKLDQLQIKNLLNLFDKINQPVYNHIIKSKDIQASVLLIIMISKILNSHYNTIKSNSKKYEAYLEGLFPLLNESFIHTSSELFDTTIGLFIQKVKVERSIKTRAYEYLYSLRDIVDTKKKLLLMSQLNILEKSNPYSTSYFSPSITIYK